MTNQSTKKFQLSEQETLAIDALIRKIAAKKFHTYQTNSNLSFEDVVQELWLKALEVCEEKQRCDLPLIAKCCYDKLVDLIRAAIRRPSTSVDPMRFEYNGEEGEVSSDSDYAYISTEFNTNSKFLSAESYSEFLDIINIFEKGTREREYIELVACYFCGAEFDRAKYEDFSDCIGRQDNYFNSWIAKKLGFVGATSRGYQMVRWAVRNKLTELGYNLNK